MRMAERTEAPHLATEVARLTDALRNAEIRARNPADALIAGLRATLEGKQRALVDAEEAEVAAQRRSQAAVALVSAETEHMESKAALDELIALQRSLPDLIQQAQRRFTIALGALAKAKEALERNTR
jgi:hypothetical protein